MFSFVQVITTCGPKKPQRSSAIYSDGGAGIAGEDDISALHPYPSPVHNCLISAAATATHSPPLLSLPRKVQHLETSFAPYLGHTNGGGGHQRQYHIEADGGGGVSEATTISADELLKASRKNVVFDTKREIITEPAKNKRRLVISPPLQAMPRGILQTSNNSAEALDRRRAKKPMSLSFTEVRSTRTISEDSSAEGGARKVDLIHDDWFGLAPLASPESLSEISSISSRATSLGKLNVNSSIERVFMMASCQEEEVVVLKGGDGGGETVSTTDYEGGAEDDLLLDEGEAEDGDGEERDMKTPVIMRRAIKIDTELSRCGDNWAEVEKYKRHGKVFVSRPPLEDDKLVDDDTDSSDCGRPSLVGSFSLSRPNAQRVNQLIPNGRKPFVEISCSSDSSSCASSLAGSFRTAQNDPESLLLIDFNSKSTDCLDGGGTSLHCVSVGEQHNRRKLNASEELLGGGGTGSGQQQLLQQQPLNSMLKVVLIDEGSRKLAQSDSAILGDSVDSRTTIGGGASLKRIDTMRQDAAKVTIMNSSSDTYHSAKSNYSGVFFKQEPITNKMASGVIESHFPVVFDLPPPSSASASPLRSQVLIRSATERHGSSPMGSLRNSPARGHRIPTVTIQYPQKPSPTRINKNNRKIYPTTVNTSKSNSFGAEESNV